MAANTAPIFTLTPVCGIKLVSTANTNRDNSGVAGGTVVTLYSAGSAGGRVEYVRVCAQGTTTAGMVRLFVYDGSTYFLWAEIPVTAAVPSGTVQCFTAEYVPTKPLVLPTGYSLRATTHNAESFTVAVHGGDF